MVNIYYIHCLYSQAAGYGIGTFLSHLIDTVKRNHPAITVVELGSTASSVVYARTDGISYIRIPAISDFWEHKESYAKNAAYILSSFIDKSARNIFHFNFSHHLPMAAKLKELYSGCRIAITIHYLDWMIRYPKNHSLFYNSLSKKKDERNAFEKDLYLEYTQERQFFELADQIVCLSEHMVALVQQTYRIGSEKLRLIRNGLHDDPERRLTGPEKERKKEEAGFGRQEQLILYAGRLSSAKGLDILIEAFKGIAPEFPRARLVIAGGGQLETWTKKAAGYWKQITFTGKLERKELYELYRIADIGVLPSKSEQCSCVAIEMWMHGLPFIGNLTPGLQEMIGNRADGCVTFQHSERENISLLAQALAQLLSSEERMQEERIKSRNLYESGYRADNLLKYIDLYADLAADPDHNGKPSCAF